MLDRKDFTEAEYAFLASQKIPLSQIYDARGRGPTSFHANAKAGGQLFGLASPCKNGGHRLFTRKGHCIQCDPGKIAYMRRFSDKGYVYIAASRKGRLLKVGSTSTLDGRASTLNTEGGYAGFDDWEIIAHSNALSSIGRIEFDIHKELEDLMLAIEYVRAGRKQTTREAIRGDLGRVWKAYQAAISSSSEWHHWSHPDMKSFDFAASS